MRHPLMLALALSLVACAPQRAYNFAFEGPTEDYPAAEQAISMWNDCPGSPVYAFVTFGRIDESDVAIVYEETLNGYPENTDVAGVYRHHAVVEYTHHANTAGLIAHEAGHAMGLQHFGQGLMNLHMLSPVVTDEDCAGLRKEKGL